MFSEQLKAACARALRISSSSNSSLLARFASGKLRKYAQRIHAMNSPAIETTNSVLPGESTGRGIKPTLAYLSPLPPDRSGIAVFSRNLLGPLSAYFDITLVHPDPHAVAETGLDFPIVTPRFLLENRARFDLVFYQMGNSEYHSFMLDIMPVIPGVVQLHDVYLSHLLVHQSNTDQAVGRLLPEMLSSHGISVALECLAKPYKGDGSLRAFDYPASWLAVRDSLHVIVHSLYALNVLQRAYRSMASDRFSVFPLGWDMKQGPTCEEKAVARGRLGIPTGTTLVCTFGMVQSLKCANEILDSWALLPQEIRTKSMLVFVGGVANSDPYAQGLLGRISAQFEKDAVKVTGWVDDALYQDYLASADVAIQLRVQSRGESSAAVLDCLSRGVPLIVNRHGSFAELPENAVAMIPERFTAKALSDEIARLINDESERRRLTIEGFEFVHATHDAAKVAKDIAEKLLEVLKRPRAEPMSRIGHSKPAIWLETSVKCLYLPFEPRLVESLNQHFRQVLKKANMSADVYPVQIDPDSSRAFLDTECMAGLPAELWGSMVQSSSLPVHMARGDILLVDQRLKAVFARNIPALEHEGVQLAFVNFKHLDASVALSSQVIQTRLSD